MRAARTGRERGEKEGGENDRDKGLGGQNRRKNGRKEQGSHTAKAYPGLCSINKRLGAFLLPPEWDFSPSQGHPTPRVIFSGTSREFQQTTTATATRATPNKRFN